MCSNFWSLRHATKHALPLQVSFSDSVDFSWSNQLRPSAKDNQIEKINHRQPSSRNQPTNRNHIHDRVVSPNPPPTSHTFVRAAPRKMESEYPIHVKAQPTARCASTASHWATIRLLTPAWGRASNLLLVRLRLVSLLLALPLRGGVLHAQEDEESSN